MAWQISEHYTRSDQQAIFLDIEAKIYNGKLSESARVFAWPSKAWQEVLTTKQHDR